MGLVIKVEDLSKQYRLGQVSTGALSHDLNRAFHKIIGKGDPYKKIGEENDRTKKGNSEYVWALKDVNFDVNGGEVIGIIGRNGAGKSTLLKILSKTTTPTTGSIKIKGRIASLLEVGTGFHPELSGRDNIFLNGAILGMTKSEIKSKFDEIVDFAGVERYIDTPVKRYSSGMYVRLAFGVAAHLEPEILIVDEVLAVGDAEFQKKALGKMKDVSSNSGRTVLFVSHNMAAIRTLTDRCLYMKNGRIAADGKTDEIIDRYSSESFEDIGQFDFSKYENVNKPLQFTNVTFLNENDEAISIPVAGNAIKIKFSIINRTNRIFENCSVGMGIFAMEEYMLSALKNDTSGIYYDIKPGMNEIICEIKKLPLSPATYKYNIILNNSSETFDWIKEAGSFEVDNGLFYPSGKMPAYGRPSVLMEQTWK